MRWCRPGFLIYDPNDGLLVHLELGVAVLEEGVDLLMTSDRYVSYTSYKHYKY